MLGESDFDVVGDVATVSEALENVGPSAPDVVILDVHLPDGNGIDLCRTLKSQFPGLACLILTAADDDRVRSEATAAGASDFLIKALHGLDLVAAVRAAADRGRVTPDVRR